MELRSLRHPGSPSPWRDPPRPVEGGTAAPVPAPTPRAPLASASVREAREARLFCLIRYSSSEPRCKHSAGGEWCDRAKARIGKMQ